MKTNTTKKRRPTGLISKGVILLSILALLLMQGQAQAWWLYRRGGW